jgi:uncharacterized membrane protein (UPF0127 family)
VLELRASDGTALWRLEVADSWFKRFKGLIGRKALPDGHGLYLPGTNGVHMLFMRFAIDCLFLGAPRPDGTRKVVGIREGLAPWTGVVLWIRGAHGVAELPEGAVSRSGLRQGDAVLLRELR